MFACAELETVTLRLRRTLLVLIKERLFCNLQTIGLAQVVSRGEELLVSANDGNLLSHLEFRKQVPFFPAMARELFAISQQ